MQFTRVHIAGLGYELPEEVVPSTTLDARLEPVYRALGLGPRQIEALSGVRERRYWPPGVTMSAGAAAAGKRALAAANIAPEELGLLIYGGVCRDNLEPATACAVAHSLGVPTTCQTYDVSNACLGVINGMVQVANAIELGQIRAGLVVSCETARDIIDQTIDRLVADPTMARFKTQLATMTGGSGAVGVVLADSLLCSGRRRLRGGVTRGANQFHQLCRWGPDTGLPTAATAMETHAVDVLENGVRLGAATWRDFLPAVDWSSAPDKIVCHQVGNANRDAILRAVGLTADRDFATYPYLGNIGTVSLPLSAALAEERGFLEPGDRVGLLGIGSGLNCIMLGVDW